MGSYNPNPKQISLSSKRVIAILPVPGVRSQREGKATTNSHIFLGDTSDPKKFLILKGKG